METPSKILLGVIGNPISHTASPAMHNAVIKQLNDNGKKLDAIYIPIHVELNNEEELINALINNTPFEDIGCLSTSVHLSPDLKKTPLSGINITIPFKETLLSALKKYTLAHPSKNIQIDNDALVIGAINTLSIRNGIYATNTDGKGFIEPLNNRNITFSSCPVTVLGCGGSAKAIINELINNNVPKITVASRNEDRFDQLKSHLKSFKDLPTLSWVALDSHECYDALASSTLVVNTTPCGMAPKVEDSPLSQFDWATSMHICYDIIYNPLQSTFLSKCHERGSCIISGSGMLAGQGARAFTIFTGIEADYKTMEKEVIHYVNSL